MTRYILKRIAIALLTMVVVTAIIFFILRLGAGNPAQIMLPRTATSAEREALVKRFGLDRPLMVQYGTFLKNAIRGDFGMSFRFEEPALELFMSRVPATVELAIAAFMVTAIIGLPFGMLTAVKRDSWLDRFGKSFALIGQATPSFWLGLLLIFIFGLSLRWFPISGRGGLNHLVLPALTISGFGIAAITRLSRSAMLDALNSDYVAMARVKGVPRLNIIIIHAFKNASIPVLTYMSLLLGHLLSGTVVVEMIFSWPGVGRLALESVFARDFPVVQVFTIFASGIYIFINLIVDISYAYIDPRIRYK